MICVALLLTVTVGQAPAPLFEHLDLARPGLETVRAAVERRDGPAAAAALRDYYRRRKAPQFVADRLSRPAPSTTYKRRRAERVLRREVTSSASRARSPPGYRLERQFRFATSSGRSSLTATGTWVQLARAWWVHRSGALRAGPRRADRDWLHDCLPPGIDPAGGLHLAETLECGIRLSGSGPKPSSEPSDIRGLHARVDRRDVGRISAAGGVADPLPGGGNWWSWSAPAC